MRLTRAFWICVVCDAFLWSLLAGMVSQEPRPGAWGAPRSGAKHADGSDRGQRFRLHRRVAGDRRVGWGISAASDRCRRQRSRAAARLLAHSTVHRRNAVDAPKPDPRKAAFTPTCNKCACESPALGKCEIQTHTSPSSNAGRVSTRFLGIKLTRCPRLSLVSQWVWLGDKVWRFQTVSCQRGSRPQRLINGDNDPPTTHG